MKRAFYVLVVLGMVFAWAFLPARIRAQEEAFAEMQFDASELDTPSEIKQQIRIDVAERLYRRAENLSQISGRIKTRMEKLRLFGFDIGPAEKSLAKAGASIAKTKNYAEKAREAALAGASLTTVKKIIRAGTESLTQAHGYLSRAVLELKVGVDGNKTSVWEQ